jgi:transposase
MRSFVLEGDGWHSSSSKRRMDLTDAQWRRLEPLPPKPRRRPDGRGRPWRDPRDVLNGVLWVLRTGAPWHDLSDRYPPYETCHRRHMPALVAGRAP